MMVVDISYGRTLDGLETKSVMAGQLSGWRGLVVRHGGPNVRQL